jgi:anti-sigma B factor antagonist
MNMLNINKTIENNKAVFALEGRLDTNTSASFENQIREAAEKVDEFVFDFAKLDYISSAGLRVLLVSQKTMSKKGGMKIINVSETVMEILEVTGFSDILTIE